MAIYAINFVASRYSLLNGLTSFDLTALRYGVAGLILLPYFWRLGLADLGGIGWRRAIVLSGIGGAPYMVIFLYGLSLAPAAHGAVLNSGAVPSVVFITMVILGQQTFSRTRAISLVLIVIGLILATGASFSTRREVLAGDLLLFISGVSWGLFTVFAKMWQLRPMQAAAITSVLSMVYLPIYLAFYYRGFDTVSLTHLVSQAAWQGLVNSIAGLFLVTYALRTLGPQLAALFSPLVPVVTTLLAIRLLGEIPTSLQWIGIACVVFGMLSAARAERSTRGAILKA